MTARIASFSGMYGAAARALVPAAAALLLGGCFATTKHVRTMEEDLTRRKAWTDERLGELSTEISQLRAENDALRLRMDDLADRQNALGGEVSGRLSTLEETDARVSDEARRAAARAAELGVKRETDREELLQRMNVILDEVVQENKKLRERISSLEASVSASGGGEGHTVQPGDTLASIAARYGTTAQAIAEANGIADPNQISVGQVLVIPGR